MHVLSVMEVEKATILRISDLIQRARPFAGTVSLCRNSCPSSIPERRQNSVLNIRQKTCGLSFQNPNPKTLKPLNYPAFLVGTLTLPSFPHDNPIKCSCFQFSDDSATVCCDILDFDPGMIGKKIRILAWNFIPFKCGDNDKSGYLEIINWDFLLPSGGNLCSLTGFSCFCLNFGACNVKDNFSGTSSIFGAIDSISPVSLVPCATGKSSLGNISGFLANILVCMCKFCISKSFIQELNNVTEDNMKGHCFKKTVIVYFCGLTSSWHPVISRLIGDVILILGLKKKLVFIGKEQSQLMYVTTDKVALHIPKQFEKRSFLCKGNVHGKGEFGCYTGIITGVYMQGIVLELDRDVMLLIDQHLCVAHSVRVGALVTLKNVHFVDPNFPWGKMVILGACCKSSLYVESFSPLETVCHLKSQSQSLLQKLINSLCFPSRLWALLVITSFRKKFTGICSEKEILGSKHKEGLAQKYINSRLPPSAFSSRHGILVEFCKHDICLVGKEVSYGHLRLVLPIANLIGFCESSWKKVLYGLDSHAGFLSRINQKNPIFCFGKTYAQPIRRVLPTEELGLVLLGTLKISLSSGRLQLTDATGGVDVMLDLPATWECDPIFEAKDFLLVMEGIPQKLFALDSVIEQPLSCRSIFCNSPLVTRMKTSLFLYCHPSDEYSRCSPFFSWKINSQELERGKFHLLMLTHKFPTQLKAHSRSNRFAQAIILPWDLLTAGKHEDAVMTCNSRELLRSSLKHFTRPEKFTTHKRCKTHHGSAGTSDYGLNDTNMLNGDPLGFCSYNSTCTENANYSSSQPLELPCMVSIKGVNYNCLGVLLSRNEPAKNFSGCKPSRSTMLLEFGPENFFTFEMLKIGCCYLVKHHKEDKFCFSKEKPQVHNLKVFISSGTHLWSMTFSSIKGVQSSDISDIFSLPNFRVENAELKSKAFEIPSLTRDNGCEYYPDVNVLVPGSALKSIENVIKIMHGEPFERKDSFKGETDSHGCRFQSEGSSCFDGPLHVGNLVSLHGLVVALHDCDGFASSPQPRLVSGEGPLMMSLLVNGGVCVHVLVESRTVKVLCDQSRQAFPVGFGEGIYASFHRILVLSGENKYVMTPVSFITINNIGLKNDECHDEFNNPSDTEGLYHNVTTPDAFPTALLSDVFQSSELTPMRFRCRVIAVYALILKKISKTKNFPSTSWSIRCSVGIPLAGFILDDGSSSCCCWADSQSAAMLLGLNSADDFLESSAEQCSSTLRRVNEIIEKHGKVVVKNDGSILDSSGQDLTVSVCSGKLISRSDEDLLISLIISTAFSSSWTVVCGPMDTKARGWLEERLTELDMAMPSLLNVWATNICHIDMLAEARNIIQELKCTKML